MDIEEVMFFNCINVWVSSRSHCKLFWLNGSLQEGTVSDFCL